MFETKPRDNSSLYLKLLLRKSFLNLGAIEKKQALDLFAGKGELASRLYLDFSELHLVEQNRKQFQRLKEKFSKISLSGQVWFWQMKNLRFLAEKLPGFSELDLVDFDAYGSPNLQILAFFQRWKVRKNLLVFATDGSLLARIRGGGFVPCLYLAGPDERGASGYDPVLGRNYERLILGFWEELSKNYHFELELFKLLWKKGGKVAYYGALIKPR